MAAKRRRCHVCDRPASHDWTMRPCALGRRMTLRLCTGCDIWLNSLVLVLRRVRGRKGLMARYSERAHGR
jgi:hypothetical protein